MNVVYDPADITELTIEYEGHESWPVRELVIGERAGKRPLRSALPDRLRSEMDGLARVELKETLATMNELSERLASTPP